MTQEIFCRRLLGVSQKMQSFPSGFLCEYNAHKTLPTIFANELTQSKAR